jgi:hypothetical protein
MKNQLIKTVILAVIGAALALQAADAQITPNAANGDLIFGAETINGGTASGTDLEVDLGSISNFTLTAKLTFSNVSSIDLGSVLGTGYATASNDFWSVVGSNGTSDVGGYFQDAAFLTITTPPASGTLDSQNTLKANTNGPIVGVYNGANQQATTGFVSAPNSNGSGAELAVSNSGSYSTWEGSAAGASTFFGLQGVGTTSFGSGGTLALYVLNSGGDGTANRNAAGTTTELGTFSYTKSGGLVFTGIDFGVVPEPSTYALMLSGLAVLFFIQRRRALKS